MEPAASLPDSITNIGNFAFCNTSTLTNLLLPPNLLRIGDYAFAALRHAAP